MTALVLVDQMNALYELGHRRVIDIHNQRHLCMIEYLLVVVTFRQPELLQ